MKVVNYDEFEEESIWRQLHTGVQAVGEQLGTTGKKISNVEFMRLYSMVFHLNRMNVAPRGEGSYRTRRERLFAKFQTIIKHRIQEQMRTSSSNNSQTETTLNQTWATTKATCKFARNIFMDLDRFRINQSNIARHPELNDAICLVFEELVLVPHLQKRQASLPAVSLEQVIEVISEENCILRLEKELDICDQSAKPIIDPDLETFKQFCALLELSEPRNCDRARALFRYPVLARAVFARGTFWKLAHQNKTHEVAARMFCVAVKSAMAGRDIATISRSRAIIVNELVYILRSGIGIRSLRGAAEQCLNGLGFTSTDVLLIHLQTWSRMIQTTSFTIPFKMLPMDKIPMIRACLEQ